MALALMIFGIAFAAFCVWLTVRIVNRRERWAKRTLAGVVGVPMLYVASIGPACWISSWTGFGSRLVSRTYQPVIEIARDSPDFGPFLALYCDVLARDGWRWAGSKLHRIDLAWIYSP
jgi:hypothetical protein